MGMASYRAVILDMDGVMTQTATVHARAWRQAFDAFFRARGARTGEDHAPFDTDEEYRRYVDGMPRHDGIRSFMAARGVPLPDGDPGDDADSATVYGLGRRKNEIFQELLHRDGADTFPDAVEQVRRWRQQGVRIGLITSSRNGEAVLAAAGVRDLFDVVIDGVVAERLGLAGKPAPDVFLEAARRLDVEPGEALVVEDAIAGVAAARAGGFACVVGVARNGGNELREHGADVVVSDVRDADSACAAMTSDQAVPAGQGPAPAARAAEARTRPDHALDHSDRIIASLRDRRLALFLDYDGTLTPIVRRPEDARLTEGMRSRLRTLAGRCFVAIVSGRDLDDVRAMVNLEELHYAGSHGFDIRGPDGLHMQQQAAVERLPDLDAAEQSLRRELDSIKGAWLERKRFALAVHFRETAAADESRVAEAVDRVLASHARLRKRGGKKIFELQPDVPWHKGRAVLWLMERLGLDGPDVLPAYIGDDVTDEDAFTELAGRGLGVRVGSPDEPTAADYFVHDTVELERFLHALTERLEAEAAANG
jgi:trehalose-phosphatase